jgi:hypothetical protein
VARIILYSLPLVYGVARAVRGAWLSDDAFISFRYVDHWVRGLGLVYNPGERVEGYTHFLWVLLLGVLHRLGFDLEFLGRALPLLAWTGLLALLFVHAVRHPREAGGMSWSTWPALPIAAWALALHHDAQVYATSGLETSLFALLLVAGLLAVAGPRPQLDLGALVYTLAIMTRPEGLLYAGTATLFILWRGRSWRPAARFAAIWAGLLLPWLAWKLAYYGTVIPNTYYAKSAALPNWSQGWVYTRLYFTVYPVLLLAAAAALAGWLLAGRGRAPATIDVGNPGEAAPIPERPRPAAGLVPLALVQVLLTVFYVTRVGGDFMFARFYIPVTPLFYLAAQEAFRGFQRRAFCVALAFLLAAGTLAAPLVRDRVLPGRDLVHGITDESRWYPPDVVRGLRHQADVLHRLCTGTSLRVVLPAGRSMVGYFSRIPYAVESTGLTDAEIARLPITKRGRPGHEKGPTDELLARRQVPLVLLWGAHRAAPLAPMKQVRVEDLYFRLVYYDAAVMDLLTRRGAQFLAMPVHLDRYLDRAGRMPIERLRRDFADFDQFYFQHTDDPVRRARFEALLRGDAASALDAP